MNQQLRLPESPSQVAKHHQNLISGIWLRWDVLTPAERFVCISIVLIPLWWLMGWAYMLMLLVTGVTLYEILHDGNLRLKRPSLIAVSAITFGLYTIASRILNTELFTPSLILHPINGWVCYGLLIWYIQSKDIRVRLQVVAWAISVLAVQMLVFWLVIHFIFSEPNYTPSRTLFGLLASKNERFIPGLGNSNYLMPYLRDKTIGGLSRFVFFFPGPEAFALTAGFMSLLALDIKNRTWSVSLFLVCVFLLLLSGTRSTWLAFPFIIGIRYFFTIGKVFGPVFLCTVMAVVSFATLSLPVVTNLFFDTSTSTVEATSNFRGDSTEVRHKIYERTLDAVLNEPDNLVLGRGVPGNTVLPGYAPAMVGTHSFILGALLYRAGLLGTGIFVTYWTLLILWFYNTRVGRPACCLLVLLFFSITFATMELESPVMPITLVCAVLREPTIRLTRKMQYA